MAELVLPLVIRIERAAPPARTDALEAAARAVLFMLTTTEPDWAEAVASWNAERIRKLVRRARGAPWRRALAVPGLDLVHRTAAVRVYPPLGVTGDPPGSGDVGAGGWPPELARLQVGGTELADPVPAGPVPEGVPLVLLAPRVAMSAGKAMAQAGHAAQLGWRAAAPAERAEWQAAGFPLAVRTATPAQWARSVAAGAAVVHDAGFTEVAPDTQTALFAPGQLSSDW